MGVWRNVALSSRLAFRFELLRERERKKKTEGKRANTRTCPRGSQVRDMWSLRLAGSLKLKVSFAEYSLFNTALLQKRPVISRSILVVATPWQLEFNMIGLMAFSLSCFLEKEGERQQEKEDDKN